MKQQAPDVYVFAAYSGTGKTTYLTKLIPCLKARGLQVAAVKHDVHGLSLDVPGKDSHRLAQAGADAVAVVCGGDCLISQRAPLTLKEVLRRLPPADIVLAEGFKGSSQPKIALYRQAAGQPPAADLAACAAVVTDTPLACACPVFPLNDPEPLAAWLAGRRQGKEALIAHHT